MIALLGAALAAPAAADAAEALRLQQELAALSQRNLWPAVDRTYRDLLALGVAPLPTDHVAGASAALSMGAPALAWRRLRRVVEGEAVAPEQAEAVAAAVAEAARIRSRYGCVALHVGPGGPALTADAAPFARDEQGAVAAAARALSEAGDFRGLLPVGAYHLGESAFTVVSGEACAPVGVAP